MEPLMTTEEVAEYLRVEVVTVRRLSTRGELPAYRIGGEYRFIAQDLENFVKSQRVAGSGGNSFDKFTEGSRRVLSCADEEANELGHNYIGTEHLLLGIVREGEGVAAVALVRSGLDLKDVRQHVMNILEKATQRATESPTAQLKAAVHDVLGMGRSYDPSCKRPLTRRAKKVIELAVDEARRMKHNYIGTEHLLLGILREGEGIAAGVLVDGCGLRLNGVRDLILQILQENSMVSLPEVPERATNLLAENELGIECSRCHARSPEYFRYCFHCGLKFP